MLEALRNKKNWILRVMVAMFVAVLMVGFGVEMFYDGPSDRVTAAAKVDDTEISLREFQRSSDQILRMYRQQFGPNFEKFQSLINVEQQAIDSLINNRLLSKLAEDLRLSASTNQVEEKILESPFFASGYNPEMFRQYLRAVGMNGEELEANLRREIIQNQLTDVLNDVGIPASPELRRIYESEEQKVRYVFAKFTPTDFERQVDTSNEAELKAYFEKNRESFRTPQKVQYSYASLTPERFEAKVTISEEDLQAAYEERRNDFTEPREYKLRQIVFRADKEDDSKETNQSSLTSSEAKKKQAEDVVEKLKAGESFEKLAREISDDENTKAQGGDVGWKKSTELSPEILTSVQDLDRGEFSGVLETDDGFTVIRLEEVKESRQKPLEEVRATLEKELRAADAPLYAAAEADKLLAEWQNSSDTLEAFAAKNQLAFTAGEKPIAREESLGSASPDLTAEVIGFSAGARELVHVGEEIYFVEVRDNLEPTVPPFEEVKDRVIANYRREKSRDLAKAKASEAIAKASEKATQRSAELSQLSAQNGPKEIPNVLAEVGIESSETQDEAKKEHSAEFMNHPNGRNAALSLTVPQPLVREPVDLGNVFYVVQLRSVAPPPADEFEKKKATLLAEEHGKAGNRLSRALIEGLRGASEIWVNPEVLRSPAAES